MLGFLLPLAASLGASGSSLGGTRSLMKFKPPIPTLNLNASSATGTSPSRTPNCPPGPWHQTGQIDATHPLCGLSNDGVTESSAALAQCLQLACVETAALGSDCRLSDRQKVKGADGAQQHGTQTRRDSGISSRLAPKDYAKHAHETCPAFAACGAVSFLRGLAPHNLLIKVE